DRTLKLEPKRPFDAPHCTCEREDPRELLKSLSFSGIRQDRPILVRSTGLGRRPVTAVTGPSPADQQPYPCSSVSISYYLDFNDGMTGMTGNSQLNVPAPCRTLWPNGPSARHGPRSPYRIGRIPR